MSIGIVISTPGRRSLARTLQSIFYQREPVEDVLVVGDGFHAPTKELVEFFAELGLPARYQATRKTRDWGHSQVNYGLEHVRGDYVTYQDDDDIYLPRALEEMARLTASLDTPRPLLGRVKSPHLGLLWQMPGENAVLDGHCLVAPNDKKRLGWMDSGYNGDQCLLNTTLRNYPEWAWTDRIWTLTRPHWTIMPWEQEHQNDRWRWTFHREGDVRAVATLEMTKVPDVDAMTARILQRSADITGRELEALAEFAVFAAQGNDTRFAFDARDILASVLPLCNFKEHHSTEYDHSWPPDFWPALEPFTRLLLEDGSPSQDYRDDCWGGRAV